jgi:hypothetical protein
MPDAKTRLLETVVRPLAGGAEMQLAGTHLLGELAGTCEKGAEEALQRWDAVDAEMKKPCKRRLFWALFMAVLAAVWLTQCGEIIDLARRITAWKNYEERIASEFEIRGSIVFLIPSVSLG